MSIQFSVYTGIVRMRISAGCSFHQNTRFSKEGSPMKSDQNSSNLKCQLPTHVLYKDIRRKSNYIKVFFKISWATKPV